MTFIKIALHGVLLLFQYTVMERIKVELVLVNQLVS